MKRPRLPAAIALVTLLLSGVCILAAQPPSRFGVDSPELAPLGEFVVGVRTIRLVQPDQLDLLALWSGEPTPRRDRVLNVDLWYPARAAKDYARGAVHVTYSASLPSESPAPPATFTVPGIATRDAPALGGSYPLIIVSHGYSNATVAMSWLTENLASKGYVVAAIRHEDPDISDRSKFPSVLLRRPLDIAFVARSLQSMLGDEHLIDPQRIGLIGYSMGGYGVLSAAGATLDPKAEPAKLVPNGYLLPFTRGGNLADTLKVKGVRAVVAIAPAGGGTLAAWGQEGLQALRVPMLLIAGDADKTVNYMSGAHAFFEAAVHAPRYLLTFENGGHEIGLNPVPDEMRSTLWDQDWFEDPVWSKSRITSINAHFITAFLDRYVKGDDSRAAYLDVRVSESSAGEWPADAHLPYDAYSPGTGAITVWKGFQRNHSAGLRLQRADAVPLSR